MRARVIDRQSGEAVDEIEAASVYELFQALLDWGERQGLPRFQVPLRYRTDRSADAPALPVEQASNAGEPLLLPLFDHLLAPAEGEVRPKRTRRPRKPVDEAQPAAEQPRLF